MAKKQNTGSQQTGTPTVVALGIGAALLYWLSSGMGQQVVQTVQSCCAGK